MFHNTCIWQTADISKDLLDYNSSSSLLHGPLVLNEYGVWCHKKIFSLAFRHFHDHISVEHDEKSLTHQLWHELVHGGPRYGCMNTYLAPLKSVQIGLVHNCLEPDQFTLITMGLIRYSCRPILSPHELIPNKFGLLIFFIMLPPSHGIQIAKMQKMFFVMSSLLYSIVLPSYFL